MALHRHCAMEWRPPCNPFPLVCLQMSGTFKVDGSGNVDFKEEDGIDYAPVTVQLPGGERVPFLFTVKELQAKGSLEGFGGDFVVPSYRGSSFLDPKVSRFESAQAATTLPSRCPLMDYAAGAGCEHSAELFGAVAGLERPGHVAWRQACIGRLNCVSSFSGHLATCCIWCRAARWSDL